jgi:hypothetical protein
MANIAMQYSLTLPKPPGEYSLTFYNAGGPVRATAHSITGNIVTGTIDIALNRTSIPFTFEYTGVYPDKDIGSIIQAWSAGTQLKIVAVRDLRWNEGGLTSGFIQVN